MSLGKALLFGAIGVGAGLLLAAWAETLDSKDSSESDLDFEDDGESGDTGLGDTEETIETETDEVLKGSVETN